MPPTMTTCALLLPALALTAAATAAPGLSRDCSYFGHLTAAGACTCAAPWQGARCNELPDPPAAASGRRDYAALLRGSGAVVAACDPVDHADCTAGLQAALSHNGTVFVPRLQDEHG